MSDLASADAKAKLKQLINEGGQILRECEDLKEGLKDTVKHVAEEHDIPVAVLNKAIRTAHKMDLEQQIEDFEELQAVLVASGRA